MEAEFAGVRATPEQVRELVLRDAGMRAGSPTSSRGRAIAATACSCCRRGSVGHRRGAEPVGPGAPRGGEPRGGVLAAGHPAGLGRPRRPLRRLRAALQAPRRPRTPRGERLVLIGDGVSDRCVAQMADIVFARAHLARDLTADGCRSSPSRTSTRCARSSRPARPWRHEPARLAGGPPAADWVAMEERVLAFWRERDVFRRSLEARRGSPPFVFYEGPPGERAPRRAPRPLARLQGHLPALPDDARALRRPARRLGLPRPAGGDRGRAAAGHLRQAADRGLRHRRVQRSAASRWSPTSTSGSG